VLTRTVEGCSTQRTIIASRKTRGSALDRHPLSNSRMFRSNSSWPRIVSMVAPQVVNREWVATAHAGVHGSGGATTPFTEAQAPSPAQQTLRKQGRLRSACSKRTQQWDRFRRNSPINTTHVVVDFVPRTTRRRGAQALFQPPTGWSRRRWWAHTKRWSGRWWGPHTSSTRVAAAGLA
jgi:hypothetical protein